MDRPVVYFAVLNMGLGHASRSLPLIKSFEERGWEVLLGSNGRALEFLKQELPQLSFVQTPDYRLRYATGIALIPKLLVQLPQLALAIYREWRFTQQIVAANKPAMIISDHCYGAYHKKIPSLLLAHQLVFEMPPFLGKLRNAAGSIHLLLFKAFDKILVPDLQVEKHGLLSGRLSEFEKIGKRIGFIGPLNSLPAVEEWESYDTVIAISGPEPQRTVLEELVLAQAPGIPGKTMIVLGRPESQGCIENNPRCQIYTHVGRRQLARAIAGAKLIVCRPGYSTLMELAFLGKPALLIPTPGQTEQEYLARYHAGKGFYHVCPQQNLDLVTEIANAREKAGLIIDRVPSDSVSAFWQQLSPFLPTTSPE